MDSVLQNGSVYIMRRDPSFDIPEHRRFLDTVVQARPISDIMYMPIRKKKSILGHFAIARAGLSSPVFSDAEVNLFLFLTPFIADVLVNSLNIDPPHEMGAYVDYQGNVIFAGSSFRNLVLKDEMKYSIIQAAYLHFLHGQPQPGMDHIFLSIGTKTYSVRYRLLPSIDLRSKAKGVPFASIDIFEKMIRNIPNEPFSTIMGLAPYGLTIREKQVVEELYRGLSNKSIALKLGVDESTIKRHTHNIYGKTGFSSRVELVLGIKADK